MSSTRWAAWLADDAASKGWLTRAVRGARFVWEETDVGRFSAHARALGTQPGRLRALWTAARPVD